MAKRRKTRFPETPVTRQEYYRLLAEVRAIRVWIGQLWLSTHTHLVTGEERSQAECQRIENEFDHAFDKSIATSYSRLLEQVEDISPRLAADLDDRSPEEIV